MTAVRVCNDFGAQENKGDSEVDSSLRNTHLGFFSSSIRSKLWDEPVERWKESKKEGTLIPLGKISRYSTHQLHIILGQSDSHTIKPGCTG